MDESGDMNLPRLLRLSEILLLVKVSKSTIMRWILDGNFPPPVDLPIKLKLWAEPDIRAWLAGNWKAKEEQS